MKIFCIMIGFICLYYDISAIERPAHMRDTLQEIAQAEQPIGNVH